MLKAKVQPDVISCNAASSDCEKVGQWQPAFTLFEAMSRAKVQPNAITYIAAISACGKGGQWQEALAMLMAKVQPDVIHSVAISAYAKGGQWQEALAFMLTAKVQPNLISAAISACERGGQRLAALTLLRGHARSQMSSDCLRPCPRPKFSWMPPQCGHQRPVLRCDEMSAKHGYQKKRQKPPRALEKFKNIILISQAGGFNSKEVGHESKWNAYCKGAFLILVMLLAISMTQHVCTTGRRK